MHSLILSKLELQCRDILPQLILPADLERSGEVVHLLEVPDGLEALGLHVLAPGADPVGRLCSRGQIP